MQWEYFRRAILAIHVKPHLGPEDLLLQSYVVAWDLVVIKDEYYGYDQLRYTVSTLKCTDVRDYIYAIQGLLYPDDALLDISPDTTLSNLGRHMSMSVYGKPWIPSV